MRILPEQTFAPPPYPSRRGASLLCESLESRRMDNDPDRFEIITPNEWRAAIDEWRRKQSQSPTRADRPVYVDSMAGVLIFRAPLPDVRSLSPSATDGRSAMRLRYQLVLVAYAVASISAVLLSDNRDYYGGRFEWGIYWLFALIVPTILAAFILLISWVVSPPRSRRHRR